ncbi:MAG: 2,3,4,5-tetrahydropyridine-2,6-dicarboxylate N-succinyltransferase [Gemmatimonadaceae bacterium]|nr:2,3,4,5-tetrahydropyridine-2,6-dicarboxylate N-succinyltransferase [Gemmatimonadaceae bacterium]
MAGLAARVAAIAALPPGAEAPEDPIAVIDEVLARLEAGTIRAAARDGSGTWRAVPWVKQGILLAFRFGKVADLTADSGAFSFVDKHTMPPRRFGPESGVRIVPGGSTIRRGAFVSPGVVCMPPMFVNVGAWIGEGTMVDSHALVGSCAQVGARVHLSAAAQVGGVLEPINANPVVIEDDVVVGGNCGVYEGTIVRERAVLGAGVILTRGTPVFDLVRETVYRAVGDSPLVVPAGAVVVPGARGVRAGWGAAQGIALQTPVIVKYRDERTDVATALEAWLR